MKIVADENIPYVNEAFSTLGEVVLRPGRAITPEDVKDATILLVRSVTRVDAALLEGSAVRFVATATIGEDHIDRVWLQENDIAFSSAPGCNANSVGEYLVAALLHLAEKHDIALEKASIGIIGAGNAGSNVARKAAALGMRVILNDPPLGDATGEPAYRPLNEALTCDFITTHVPLVDDGFYPTRHLVNAELLERVKRGTFYINTARGPVADNGALLDALNSGRLRGAVLDVWEGEPEIPLELMAQVDIATPHIAGYSFDGKVKGTCQIYDAACAFLSVEANWSPESLLPPPGHPELHLYGCTGDLKRAVDLIYAIQDDNARMRAIAEEPAGARAGYFDQLRKNYPRRREFHNTRVVLKKKDPSLTQALQGIGFRVQ